MVIREFRDQFWEPPLSIERDKMSFLPVLLEWHHGFRGKMCGVIEELPLVVFEEEAGNFRGGKALISFQKWFPKSSQDNDSLLFPFVPFQTAILLIMWSPRSLSTHHTPWLLQMLQPQGLPHLPMVWLPLWSQQAGRRLHPKWFTSFLLRWPTSK